MVRSRMSPWVAAPPPFTRTTASITACSPKKPPCPTNPSLSRWQRTCKTKDTRNHAKTGLQAVPWFEYVCSETVIYGGTQCYIRSAAGQACCTHLDLASQYEVHLRPHPALRVDDLCLLEHGRHLRPLAVRLPIASYTKPKKRRAALKTLCAVRGDARCTGRAAAQAIPRGC